MAKKIKVNPETDMVEVLDDKGRPLPVEYDSSVPVGVVQVVDEWGRWIKDVDLNSRREHDRDKRR